MAASGVRSGIGALLFGLGIIVMLGIWLYTTYVFFATGQTLLAIISLVIPPADIVLPFLISPALGLLGLAGMAVAFVGAALKSD